MKKTILVYGLLGGLLIALLKFVEYRFLIIEHSLEVYGGIVALLFSILGIWLGLKLTRTRETVVVREVPVRVEVSMPSNGPFVPNAARQEELGITPADCSKSSTPSAGRRRFSAEKRRDSSPERMVFALVAKDHPFR